ncbi:DNA-binding transcriptional MocR family regulator [Paenarthrobacter nitroguajacolicus]|uniref:aminotransferase-like domain-containing protein n=1 Tax=Paenarthrobacter nitroguajacolicus TaxID=211146 RepID=UPI00285D077A|nr:PLP-dependent aminotransferase family protein [Paenarthrobacter nitroguajacolicus]MDR6989147.1 DNA-binding transcriptional MocR family regulator [Paenarthrobacter nitroguajacolicus]
MTLSTDPTMAETLLADRVRTARSSEVRKVFMASQKRGVISFAGGAPYLGVLPFDRLAASARRIMAGSGAVSLQYGASQGIPELRRHVCALMELEGISADPDDIVVTSGSQQALDLAARILVNPGDVIFAEAPSYAGGLAVFTGYQAEIIHVPVDGEGLVPEELEQAIAAVQTTGRTAKGLYTIPNFQNPRGINLSAERRHQIGEICRRNGLLIFEDNPYGLLAFDGNTRRAIQPDFPDITMYFGSFSKIIAPGLRLGWVLPPAGLYSHFVNASETTLLNPPVYNQQLLCDYLDNPAWKATLDESRGLYEKKGAALVEALEQAMPAGTSWIHPTGGFYLWLTLPEGVDTGSLVFECIERGVAYVPGTAFYADGRGSNELRLSFCLPTIDEIRKGGAILGQLFREATEAGTACAAATDDRPRNHPGRPSKTS